MYTSIFSRRMAHSSARSSIFPISRRKIARKLPASPLAELGGGFASCVSWWWTGCVPQHQCRALASQGPNSITVAGTCTESVFLDKRERLVIQAAPGQTATIIAADPSAIVLQTFGSQGVVLSSLVFQGGVNGVIVNQGSNVSMLNCTVQQNSIDCLVVQIGSTLVI